MWTHDSLRHNLPEIRFDFKLLSWRSDEVRSSTYRGHGFRGSKPTSSGVGGGGSGGGGTGPPRLVSKVEISGNFILFGRNCIQILGNFIFFGQVCVKILGNLISNRLNFSGGHINFDRKTV